MRLENYVSIITGVGSKSGIAHEIALQFAKEGSNLILNYYHQDKNEFDKFIEELQKNDISAIGLEGDISDADIADGLIETALNKFGKIDVLVNTAGIANQVLCEDISLENWNRIMEVNLTSVFLTCRRVIPAMIKQRFGRIINIASQNGQKGAIECCHYAASKAGMIGFTKSLAREVGTYGITANCIAPGPINTEMLAETKADWVEKKKNELVIPRFGEVNEVAPSAVFLASVPDGNIFTGQTLGPNSGDVML